MTVAFDLVKRHEGFRATVYCDACGVAIHKVGFYWVCDCRFAKNGPGNLTIGSGIRVDGAGISEHESDALLTTRLSQADDHLSNYSWFDGLSDNRRAALIDLCHNVGRAGFDEFKGMIADIAAGDFVLAAGEMLDSKWAKQVPARAAEDAKLLEQG